MQPPPAPSLFKLWHFSPHMKAAVPYSTPNQGKLDFTDFGTITAITLVFAPIHFSVDGDPEAL